MDLPKELFYKLKEDIKKATVNTDIIKKSIMSETRTVSSLITLFGLSAEELSEAGVPFENLMALGSLVQ